MKHLLIASAGIGSVLGIGSASAADVSAAFKSAPVMAPAYSWTGCYIGSHGGGSAFRNTLVGTWSDGGLFGGEVGCNYQIDYLVVAIEGEGSWSGVKSTTNVATGFGPSAAATTFQNDWDADIAARFGVAYSRFFSFGKIGAWWGNQKFTAVASGPGGGTVTGEATSLGIFWGIGLEYGFTPQWTAKFEFDYIHFAATDITLTCNGPAVVGMCGTPLGTGTMINSTNTFAIVGKSGINYRF